MRTAASLVLLAGCDVVLAGCDVLFQLQDVHPPPDAIEDASEPDAVPIPPVQCSFPPAGFNVGQLGTGTFYTVDAGVTTAVFENNDMIYLTTPGMVSTTQQLFSGMTGLRSPRLSPDGTELFMHSSKPCCNIVVSKLEGNTWLPPEPITVKGLSIGADELPGTPTAGINARRRIMLSVSGTDMFWELVEEPDGWHVVANYRDYLLGMAAIQDANLTPDGYRVFFGGVRQTGGSDRVWAMDRTDLTVEFEGGNNIVEVHDSMQNTLSVRSPYVTPDCKSLWFSVGTNASVNTVRRGIAL